jgi:Glycosyl transferase family 2
MQARTPRVVVLTMVRDEAEMLPRWLEYYGGQVGVENLLVLDDNTTDGSTDDLPCSRHRLPPGPWERGWEISRVRMVNGIARGLLACYDVAVFTDVDEFLVPDPALYDGLLDYLRARAESQVMAPVAVNVLHDAGREPDLDSARPLLEQRRLVKFAPGMCKPLLKRVVAPWSAAFHGIRAPYRIDRELLMLHMKYADHRLLSRVAEHRHRLHTTEGRGGNRSSWTLGSGELTSRLASWAGAQGGPEVPLFDPAEPELDDVIRPTRRGFNRSRGNALIAMEERPLRQLPQRFCGLV